MANGVLVHEVKRPEPPVQRAESIIPELLEASALIQVDKAREVFKIEGEGVTVAVLDTGLRTTHVDFAGRVVAQRNFTEDNSGDPDDATDGNGHGTNVAGIVCAGDIHIGMAPQANVIPLKVLGDEGGGSFEGIRDALLWVLDNREAHTISAVCMSLGDGANHADDSGLAGDAIGEALEALREAGVACVIAAGNDYFTHESKQGMGYPAIFRHCVSVGAVYDRREGSFSYGSGATAFDTGPDRITPFSQRLHATVEPNCFTDIFAPGAPITSSGIETDEGESIQHGTSQATPVVVGIIALLQSFHLKKTGSLPSVDQLVAWLAQGAVSIHDGDDEDDNVEHTKLDFARVDAMGALTACARDLAMDQLVAAGVVARAVRP